MPAVSYRLSLVVSEGPNRGRVVPVPQLPFVIGRNPECHLRPSSAAISGRHCALIDHNGEPYLIDFDSTNGTFLNGERLTKGPRAIGDGDDLAAGPLRFSLRVEMVRDSKPELSPEDSAAAMMSGNDTIADRSASARAESPTEEMTALRIPPKSLPEPSPTAASAAEAILKKMRKSRKLS